MSVADLTQVTRPSRQPAWAWGIAGARSCAALLSHDSAHQAAGEAITDITALAGRWCAGRTSPTPRRARIEELTRGFEDRPCHLVDTAAWGIARIAAAFHPEATIVRMSDFKTSEYAELIGGRAFEPHEENPMIGWRGASRYYDPDYRDGFALECRAIRQVREELGFTNLVVMIPFCRTPEEADRVPEVMTDNGLERGRDGLEVYVMCEIPSNVVEATGSAERFDGFSIGSNDLTQLVLGVDRDSDRLSGLFDERHDAVTRTITRVVHAAHDSRRNIGLCGQAPSDHPEFAPLLVEAGIDSTSVNPDSSIAVKEHVAAAEAAANPGDARKDRAQPAYLTVARSEGMKMPVKTRRAKARARRRT